MNDTTQTNTTKPQRAVRNEATETPRIPLQQADIDAMQAADAPADEQSDERPADFVRQPFGAQHQKLLAPARPGFRRYWFNDEPGRVQRALGAGYAHVKTDGRNTSKVVGRNGDNTAKVAYLMEIPQRWFDEDVAAQQAKIDEIDAAIKGGEVARKSGDNRYVPKDGIRYDPTRAD